MLSRIGCRSRRARCLWLWVGLGSSTIPNTGLWFKIMKPYEAQRLKHGGLMTSHGFVMVCWYPAKICQAKLRSLRREGRARPRADPGGSEEALGGTAGRQGGGEGAVVSGWFRGWKNGVVDFSWWGLGMSFNGIFAEKLDKTMNIVKLHCLGGNMSQSDLPRSPHCFVFVFIDRWFD